jgi:ABC-type Zn uptake system ZnuABC Zn-binding protein ZnuA
MKTIALQVNDEVAKKFESLRPSDKKEIEKEFARLVKGHRSLEEIMKDMSDQAERNGLTPEILEQILKEIDEERSV